MHTPILNASERLVSGSGGFLRFTRNALGMTAAQLAKRVNVTPSAIYQAERNEAKGKITLKQLSKLAEGLGCTLNYQFIPIEPIDDMLKAQAREKAERIVARVSGHMALEDQALAKQSEEEAIRELADELYRAGGSALWETR